jgi:mercuric ion transport protein
MTNPATSPASRPSGSPAALLTLSGLAAAFGLASCCALPLLLTTLGLGTAWLSGVGLIAASHRLFFMSIAALGLAAGGVLLWRQQRAAATCGPDGACTPPAIRVLTLLGLVVGLGFLWAGYTYA